MRAVLCIAAAVVSLAVGIEISREGREPRSNATTLGLFVGVDDYESAAWRDLHGAERDARALHGVLAPDAALLLGSAATLDAIRAALRQLLDEVDTADAAPRVVIALTGHTTRIADEVPCIDESDGRDEAFCAVDARADGRGALRDDELGDGLRRLLDAGAEVLLVADTCHAAGLVDGVPYGGSSSAKFIAALASREHERAAEIGRGTRARGRFSMACLRAIDRRRPRTDWRALGREIEREYHALAIEAAQTPVFFGLGARHRDLPEWLIAFDERVTKSGSHARRKLEQELERLLGPAPAETRSALTMALRKGSLDPRTERVLLPALRRFGAIDLLCEIASDRLCTVSLRGACADELARVATYSVPARRTLSELLTSDDSAPTLRSAVLRSMRRTLSVPAIVAGGSDLRREWAAALADADIEGHRKPRRPR